MEFYNIETADQNHRTKINVIKSLQHDPYERILTVSKRTLARVEEIAPGAKWHCAAPTPHWPLIVFEAV